MTTTTSPMGALRLPDAMTQLIRWQIIFPVVLLILGIYHGFLQTLYRAGFIKTASFLGLEYYQGLTIHGVVNAVVFTTFFAVAFGNAVVPFYLRQIPSVRWAWVSMALMLVGTLMAAVMMLSGNSSVLYTFYPPMKASPFFYLGAALLIVGSWVAFFNWIPAYLRWRQANPAAKVPMAVLGMFATFIVWLMATLPVAVEVIFFLIPWSAGWVDGINVMLARTLFWFFGHPLVYFWLLPAYTMLYSMFPAVAGGKLFSDFAGRFAFFMFIVFSAPIGLHHQFADPGITVFWKWLHTILTACVALPSLITAFTMAASMEHAAHQRGGRGLLGWWRELPYLATDRYLFGYLFCGLLLFLFGGITGIINASAQMNAKVHNTGWLPGHFHTTVGGLVYLAFIGMSLHLIAKLSGKQVRFPRLNVAVPYLWLFGVLTFSVALSWNGLAGEPRRTNLGLTYLNPGSSLYVPSWHWPTAITALGGTIMFISALAYFVVFFSTLAGARVREPELDFPTAQPLHDEQISWVNTWKPWLAAAGALLVIAYTLPIREVLRVKSVPGYSTDSPVPSGGQ